MGGGSGGKKGGETPKATASPYEEALSAMALKTYRQTEPLRENLIGQYQDFVSGGYNPQSLPGYTPAFGLAKTGLEDQYSVAKQNIIENMPRGGSLTGNLANMQMQRARDVGSLPAQLSSNIISDIFNKAQSTAMGGAQMGMSGMGSAASTFGSQQNTAMAAQMQQMQMQAQQQAAKGRGLGSLMFGK